MNKICHDLKKYMRFGLEDRIAQIMGDTNKVNFLSKRDLNSLMNFMERKKIYSVSIMEYIYIKSIYRYDDGIIKLYGSFFCGVCSDGHLEAAKFLLLSEEIVRRFPFINSGTCLNIALKYACNGKYACDGGHLDVVKFLLSSEVVDRCPTIDPSSKNNSIIQKACEKGYLDIVKFLLSDDIIRRFPKINISSGYNFAIEVAGNNGHGDMVKFLLSNEIVTKFPSINPRKHFNGVLKSMVYHNNIDIIKMLLQDQRVINKYLPDAINYAKMYNRKEIIDLIMSV